MVLDQKSRDTNHSANKQHGSVEVGQTHDRDTPKGEKTPEHPILHIVRHGDTLSSRWKVGRSPRLLYNRRPLPLRL